MTDDRAEFAANRDAGLVKRHEQRLARAQTCLKFVHTDEEQDWVCRCGHDAADHGLTPSTAGAACATCATKEPPVTDMVIPPDREPLRSVIDYLTDAARRVNWKPDDKHPLQARYDALRSLMSIYAYATLVSLETLQRTDSGAADRVAEHLSHDDWDVRAECALLWHESLTGGARYAPFDEELHLLAGHHDPTEAETKALVETATRLGRELGRREALDRESMIDALEAEWLRNSKQKTVGSPRSFCTRLADALIAAREIATKEPK